MATYRPFPRFSPLDWQTLRSPWRGVRKILVCFVLWLIFGLGNGAVAWDSVWESGFRMWNLGFGALGFGLWALGLDQGWGRGRWGSDPLTVHVSSPLSCQCQDVSMDTIVGPSWF